MPDINVCQLWIPYHVITTSTVTWPNTDALWDDLARKVLISVDADSMEYYGSDAIADPAEVPDPNGATPGKTSDTTLNSVVTKNDINDEPLVSGSTPGPKGIMRYNSQETLMHPLVGFADDAMRFDFHDIATVPGGGTMGVLLDVIYRYEQTRPTSGGGHFASVMSPSGDPENSLSTSVSRMASALWGGDFKRVQHELMFGVSAVTRQIKSFMWGGDTVIEDGIWTADDEMDIVATTKGWHSISTPYTIWI